VKASIRRKGKRRAWRLPFQPALRFKFYALLPERRGRLLRTLLFQKPIAQPKEDNISTPSKKELTCKEMFISKRIVNQSLKGFLRRKT